MWRARFISRQTKRLKNKISFCHASTATKPVYDSSLKEGNFIEGFKVLEVSDVPDFHMKAIRFIHEHTGAQYLHVERDDPNNAFSVGFRTTPFDSTGVPHILEHTTLCGSHKYPCRDPFFKMLNRSLATFMNAMTGPDYTIYPFSTQNEVDYRNLMSVYLDAVFRPQLSEWDFRQEGWRLEHEDISNSKSPIIFKGVVFNEMKGALSENQRIFGESLLNNLLPSHTYGVISGGDPLHIPNLTYENLKLFHSQYYHPSNARFYSYGNFPVIEHLKYINKTYLENYKHTSQNYSNLTKVPSEKRWSGEQRKTITCRVDNMAADPEKQSTLAIAHLCSDINNIQENFMLQVLSDLLVAGPNSAFYKSLVEPNIGSGFSPVTGYEPQIKDTIFTVGLQGLNPKDFDWVVDTFNKTVDKVISDGFEQDNIDGVLHRIELNVKHQSTDFGLSLLFAITSLWNHDGKIIDSMRVNDQMSNFRNEMNKNPRFLQDAVAKYLKNNSHRLVLSMNPDPKFDDKKKIEEEKLLESKLSLLNSAEKEKIYNDGISLRKQQEKPQNIECLPTLKISDLKKVVEKDELEVVEYSGIPLQVNVQPTNCLSYFRGILNTSILSDEFKPLLPIFCSIGTKMGTRIHDYRGFDQMVQLKTGGLSFSSHIVEDAADSSRFEEGILFSSYCLDDNSIYMFALWEEIFNSLTLENIHRFETLLKGNAASLVSGIADSGHLYSMSQAASLVNPCSLRKERFAGLTYVTNLCKLVQASQFEETLEKLKSLASEVLNKRHLRLCVNLSGENRSQNLANIEAFVGSLQQNGENPHIISSDQSTFQEKNGVHHLMQLPVSYTAKSIPSVPYKHEDFAKLRILCKLLSAKYLLPMVREKGGAYGAGVNINPSGVISFSSYRDPNPTQTFETFDNSVDWIMKKEFKEQDVEEAKLGTFQAIDAPVSPGSRGLRKFLNGIDDEEFQKQRLRLMAVTHEDIVDVAAKYLDSSRNVCQGRVLLGPENVDVVKRPGEKWNVNVL
uniref:Presequence protease, mitochondrial n=1 Tax=Clastoptera arizonana TaxID=38151 RepID=A0A1B6DCM2_9HEMI